MPRTSLSGIVALPTAPRSLAALFVLAACAVGCGSESSPAESAGAPAAGNSGSGDGGNGNAPSDGGNGNAPSDGGEGNETSGGGNGNAPSDGGEGNETSGGGSGNAPAVTPTIPTPDDAVEAKPAETDLELSDVPELGTIRYLPNRSSVRLYLPGVEGARDYRVFAVEDGVKVSVADDRERVEGGTLHCAGVRQRNQCDDGAVLPIKYNAEWLDLPKCGVENLDRRPNFPMQLMQTLEVNGVGKDTVLVVEAIDRFCPFPGLVGTRREDVAVGSDDVGPSEVEVVVNDRPYTVQRFPKTFPLRLESDVRQEYGSMIFNGQGWNMPTLDPTDPAFPESPYIRIGHPAPANDPVVLARSVIKVSATDADELPAGFTDQDYFDGFDDPNDQPTFVRDTDLSLTLVGVPTKVYQTNKWVLYDIGNFLSDFYVDRGQMHMVQADPWQGSMSSQAMYPKRAVQLPDEADRYLHVTYEAQRNETARRYENFSLCGSDVKGQTYDGEFPRTAPVPRPGFMNAADLTRTSPLGWNCLLMVARGPGYYGLDGGAQNETRSHSDSSLMITVVSTHPAPADDKQYNDERISSYAKGYGPTQEDPFPVRWERQIDGSGKPSGVWLDDQLNSWQRSRFDVFVRRDRVVIYVEGQQRICQELPGSPLTMAEGALGFWHVLYHTSAEFMEIRGASASDNPATGQHQIMHNTPFADHRSFDNVGFRENVELPSGFDASRCYPD